MAIINISKLDNKSRYILDPAVFSLVAYAQNGSLNRRIPDVLAPLARSSQYDKALNDIFNIDPNLILLPSDTLRLAIELMLRYEMLTYNDLHEIPISFYDLHNKNYPLQRLEQEINLYIQFESILISRGAEKSDIPFSYSEYVKTLKLHRLQPYNYAIFSYAVENHLAIITDERDLVRLDYSALFFGNDAPFKGKNPVAIYTANISGYPSLSY